MRNFADKVNDTAPLATGVLDAAEDLGQLIKFDLAPYLLPAALGLVALYFARHWRDRLELAARRRQDDPPAAPAAAGA